MRAVLLSLLLFSVLPARAQSVPPPIDNAAVEAGQSQMVAARRPLYGALIAGGAASLLVGGGLMIPSRDDQALRVAGGVTAGFGAVNLLLGALALRSLNNDDAAFRAQRRDAASVQAARDDLLRQRQQEAVVFGVNLGLDVAYATAAGAALLYARTNPEHAARWQSAGAALLAQGAFLFAIDLTGLLLANQAQRTLVPLR